MGDGTNVAGGCQKIVHPLPGNMLLPVDTVLGLHGDPEPRAFRLGMTHLVVLHILDRWYGQDVSYFKLHASDNAIYILRHNRVPGTWELTLFQSPSQESR